MNFIRQISNAILAPVRLMTTVQQTKNPAMTHCDWRTQEFAHFYATTTTTTTSSSTSTSTFLPSDVTKENNWDLGPSVTRGKYDIWKFGNHESQVLTFYRKKETNADIVVLMIPGNPGVIAYYEYFLSRLFDLSNQEIDIIAVQHLGHTKGVKENETDLFTLEEQLEHKLAFFDHVRRSYKSTTKFVLVGHSIGAWLTVNMLKHRTRHGISKIFGLFPTLENIKRTPNGRIVKVSSICLIVLLLVW